jgi:cold shock CspA family protein
LIDRGDHMIKAVASIVYGHEPNVVGGESSYSSRRILSDGIRLAIGRDVFVHISAVERAGLSTLNEGQQIEYEIEENRGKTSAVNLKVK